MKREQIEAALDEISDKNLLEAMSLKKRKKRRLLWRGAIAVAACFAILIGVFNMPQAVDAKAISSAEYPGYKWNYREEVRSTAASLSAFFENGISLTLTGSKGENQLFSPMNLYMALSMVAELTEENSRQQILNLLGVEDIETLRVQANSLWNACYRDDTEKALLANSAWLSDKYNYNQTVMDTLASTYYASVYQADLADSQTAKDIRAWLNNNTGGLLKDEVKNAANTLNSDSVLALYSTIYYQAKWSDSTEFSPKLNTEEIFHSDNGDVHCTFMNKALAQTNYYWSEDCSAIAWNLKGGSMWFILPDEGKTVDDILASGNYMDFLLGGSDSGENAKYMKVNFSVPKFDVRASEDMKVVLENLGVTDVFQLETADFSNSVYGTSVYLTSVNQSTRVCIDEKGVTAASYVEIPGAGAAEPPEEIIDFVLNRPFLFVVENTYNIPLFAGVVNQP